MTKIANVAGTVGLTALAGLIASPQSQAAPPAPADTTKSAGLEVVSVTATRRSQNILKVPSTVTAIGARTIERQHIDSAEDILSLAPNDQGYSNDGRERPRYYIRGIGNGNVADNAVGAVAIYNDEVYLNNLSMQGFPLFDLSRVEVLNGPQGTLWGKNATAGAIQFISNPPNFTPSGYAEVGLGDQGQRRAQGVVNGPINDMVAVRLAADYENQDGWAKDVTTGKNSGDFSDLALRGQALAKVNNDFDVLFSLHFRELQDTREPFYVSPAPSAASPLVLTDTLSTFNNVNDHQSLYTGGGLVRANYRFNGATLTSITSFDQAARSELLDSDNTSKEYSRGYDSDRPTQESEELRLASDAKDRLNWITGLYYFHEYVADTIATGTLPPGAPTVPAILGSPAYTRTDFAQNTQSAAAFANATYGILPGLKLTAGLRYTYDTLGIHLYSKQATGASTVYNDIQDWWQPSSVSSPLATIAQYRKSENWGKLNFEVEPQYQITPDQLLYVRIASGYRSGVFNSQVTSNPVARGGPPLQGPGVVNPETLISYEAGYKSTWFDKRLQFTADGFYEDYSNIQVSYTATDPKTRATVIALANAASGRTYGGEFSVQALPIPNLTLGANLGLLNTDFTDFTGPIYATNLSGNQFARAPKASANLSADYQIDTKYGTAAIGTHWNYTGHYFYLISNETAEALQQGGVFLGDVHASFHPANSRWDFSGIINNIGNVQYRVQTLPYSGTTHTYSYEYGPPRLFLITARYAFL